MIRINTGKEFEYINPKDVVEIYSSNSNKLDFPFKLTIELRNGRQVFVNYRTEEDRYSAAYTLSKAVEEDYVYPKQNEMLTSLAEKISGLENKVDSLNEKIRLLQSTLANSQEKSKEVIGKFFVKEDLPISVLSLAPQSYNALCRYWRNLGHIDSMTVDDLLRIHKVQFNRDIRNFGKRCLEHTVKCVHEAGLHFVDPLVDNLVAEEECYEK